MKYLLLFISITPVMAFSQKTINKKISQDSIIKKWQQALVNIESGQTKNNIIEVEDSVKAEILQGKIKNQKDSIDRAFYFEFQRNKVSGTAIYIADGNKKYLVTAKHVIFDLKATQNDSIRDKEPRKSRREYENMNRDLSIRTPFDLFLEGKNNYFAVDRHFSGEKGKPYYYFSDDFLDIAIISLQPNEHKGFIDILDKDGYKPIQISDIDSICDLKIGQDLMCIGYPTFSNVTKTKSKYLVQSNMVVLPTFTFGKVAKFHKSLSSYGADVTVYPGNSGGSVISGNKLIGIVSAQTAIPIDGIGNYLSRGVLAYIVKSKYVLQCLRELQKNEVQVIGNK